MYACIHACEMFIQKHAHVYACVYCNCTNKRYSVTVKILYLLINVIVVPTHR